MPTQRPAFLRLVDLNSSSTSKRPVSRGETQESFLPSSRANTLIFLDWSKAAFEDLLDVFELSRPKLMFDIRVAPRFDLGRLTRKGFFELSRKYECQYIDLLGRMGVESVSDALANPALVAGQAMTFLDKFDRKGPLVFLHDDDAIDDDYVTNIARNLPAEGESWQVYRPLGTPEVGTTTLAKSSESLATTAPITRSVVFISHATPQDNTFVLWLTSRLTAAGYEVWSDITHLQGGDVFWGDIEEVIRIRAAKLLFVQSTHVKGKSGTRKEAYLGLKVGARNRKKRFVIPMRIDDTPFDETLIELIDLQSIDFRGDWLSGLRSLLLVLERDGVPRRTDFRAHHFADVIHSLDKRTFNVSKTKELLVSNLLPLLAPPDAIHYFTCSGVQSHEIAPLTRALNIPAFAHYALLATPAIEARLSEEIANAGISAKVSERAVVSWQEFLAGESQDLPGWRRIDARNNAFALLSKAWRLHLQSIGAQAGVLANNRPFWYFIDQYLPDNKVRFPDFSSRLVRRQLVGYSAKRRVFWHFGIQARPVQFGQDFFFSITPHVTFSANGRDPLPSKTQLHSLRRSFCRSWWNDRWRDLMQGFVAVVGRSEEAIRIDLGASRPVQVGTRFSEFASPVSLQSMHSMEQAPAKIDDQVEDDWDDSLEESEWPVESDSED